MRASIGGFEPETAALPSLRVAWNMDGKPFFAGPQDFLDQLLKQLMQSTSVVELLELMERLLGPTSFAAGVVYGAGESVVLSVVELLDLLKTFALAELYDKVNGLPAAGQSSDTGIAGRIYNFAGAVWGRFVSELLKPAAEERDEIVREIHKIFEDPLSFFGSVADQYVDKYRRFQTLVADHALQSQFEAGKIFGEILLEVILLFIAGAGAVKTAAKAPKLLKLAKRLKGKIERRPQKLLGSGDAPARPPSQPPPQTAAAPPATDAAKPPKKLSLREQYMGRTPGKGSKTGLAVQERMKKAGTLRDGIDGPEFLASDGKWYDLSKADMAHRQDAVKWWNETGRNFGPKSPEVRKWMLDPDNYVLDHYSLNRSAGAKLGETYLPPLGQ